MSGRSVSEITVVARAKAKPGREKDLERALRDAVAPTHEEDGCLRYVLHRSVDDSSVIMVFERWTSRQALDKHLTTPHIRRLFGIIPDLVVVPPEIAVFEVLPEGKSDKGTF